MLSHGSHVLEFVNSYNEHAGVRRRLPLRELRLRHKRICLSHLLTVTIRSHPTPFTDQKPINKTPHTHVFTSHMVVIFHLLQFRLEYLSIATYRPWAMNMMQGFGVLLMHQFCHAGSSPGMRADEEAQPAAEDEVQYRHV
jgi:hypothetical protein